MSTASASSVSEMAILRRIVDAEQSDFTKEAAQAILRLSFKHSGTRTHECLGGREPGRRADG